MSEIALTIEVKTSEWLQLLAFSIPLKAMNFSSSLTLTNPLISAVVKMRPWRQSQGNGLILSRKAISDSNVFGVQGRATHPHYIHCSVTSRT